MRYQKCPKCGALNEGDPEQCEVCGIYFSKWLRASLSDARKPARKRERNRRKKEPESSFDWTGPWVHVGERVNPVEFWGRVIVLVGLGWWSVLLISTHPGITTGLRPEISFYDPVISSVTLVFHEAGHVLFMPFGRFMTVLGGSLFELMVPLGLTLGFVYYYKNPFAGSVTTWWLAYAFMDVAAYMYDAKPQQLLLLGGGTGSDSPGSHDWNNLLRWTGLLDEHAQIAGFTDFVGEVLMIVAIGWGARVLFLQFNRLDRR